MAKRIDVSLARQVVQALDGDTLVYSFNCVSGDSSHATPRGSFRVYRKERDYISHQYKVPMNYAMFFKDGVAIHEAYLVGPMSYIKSAGIDWFGSHGCVRLSHSDAVTLFDWAPIGTQVNVS